MAQIKTTDGLYMQRPPKDLCLENEGNDWETLVSIMINRYLGHVQGYIDLTSLTITVTTLIDFFNHLT